MIEFRQALPDELDSLKNFLFEHGTNPWNHLPKEGVDHEFELVAQGNASALIAADNNQPIGLAIFYHPKSLPEQYRQYSHSAATLYIAEVVVHSNYAGRGIGSQLLSKITDCARTVGATFILAHRHEENLASAGMMRKAGFKELATFVDLDRRDFGNRSTTVLSLDLG